MGKKTENDKESKEEVDSDSDMAEAPVPESEPSVEQEPQVSLPVANAKVEMVTDRHSGYSSTTSMQHGPRGMLAVHKLRPTELVTVSISEDLSPPSSPRRPKSFASPRNGNAKSHQASTTSLNSTAQSFRSAVSKASAASTQASLRSHISTGVQIRLPMLPRADAIPCQMTGKRNLCAPDTYIRIYLSLSGSGHKVQLWVHPDLTVGPKRASKDRFHAIWGQDAEEAGPFGARANVPTKRTAHVMNSAVPLNPHLSQIRSDRSQEDSVVVSVGLSPRKAKKERHLGVDFNNFRELVYDTTGIEPAEQKLFFATRRMSDDEKTLADYGVGQGAIISCWEHKAAKGREIELASTAARHKLFDHDPSGHIRGKLGSLASCLESQHAKEDACKARLMLRWNHEPKPQCLHRDDDPGTEFLREMSVADCDKFRRMPTRTDTHDFRNMHDNGCFDLCDPIRHRFESIQKAADSATAWKQVILGQLE